MPSQPRRRNKLPHPSTPLLLLFHIKRFAQQNLAAGGIHFRRGYSFPVRGPRKMPRHFVGTDKSSWTSCTLPSQPRRRNKFPITSKRSGRCPLLFRLSKKPRRVRGPQAANRVPSIFRGGMYVAKNTLRGESVFVGACAHGRAGRSEIPFVKKGRRPFLTSSAPEPSRFRGKGQKSMARRWASSESSRRRQPEDTWYTRRHREITVGRWVVTMQVLWG